MPTTTSHLSPAERRAAVALAEAIIPGSSFVPGADESLVRVAEELVGEISGRLVRPWASLQRMLDAAAIARAGRPLHALSATKMDEVLRSMEADPVLRVPLMLIGLVYKAAHFDRPDVYAALGGRRNEVHGLEQPRWLAQVHDARAWSEGDDLDCDVVVVGTGAGGAVVGRELAERGHAVVFVEEGHHYRRDAFTGSSLDAHRRFYRAAVAMGNAMIPVFIGRLVGGSTAINTGSCYRTPDWILDEWCQAFGGDEFSPANVARHFARVEERIGVQPAPRDTAGPISNVIARGCDRLGWSHFSVLRNVSDGCDGKGFCDFGCRTDARRSTNLSYIPQALEAGALCLTHLRAERVLVESGRAAGIEAVAGEGRRMRIRARAVVLAGGAVPTPVFLQKQGLCNGSGELGRNLTLHPSAGLAGLFDDEDIRPWEHVPQGYGCDEFLREGQLIAAAQPDVNVAPLTVPFGGRRLMDVIEDLPRIGAVGMLARDCSANGRVRGDVAGFPVITYNLGADDRDRIHQGMVRAGEMLLAAGARRLYVARPSMPIVEARDFEKFRQSRPEAQDLILISYHPLGTCRMGRDPKTSVVGLDHQTHDVRGLYIVDGSVVRGPLGVNPQLTIMMMATRAADPIHAAL